MMKIMGVHCNQGGCFPEIRGVVEKAKITFLKDGAILEIEVSGKPFAFSSKTGVPTIFVGQEVILSLEEEESYVIMGIQIISGQECLLRVSGNCSWVAHKK